MTARAYAAIIGGLAIALGIAGFVPAFWERYTGPGLSVNVFQATLFGLLPSNIISSMAHLTIGLWGSMSANSKYPSLVFTRASTILFVVMGILGIVPFPEAQTLFGTLPLQGNNVWLHFGVAVIGVIFSFRPGFELTQVGVKEDMNPHMPNK